MSSAVRIIGIGSPHGADRAGWLIAERLSCREDLDVAISAISSPLSMLDHLEGCESLLIVDACISGAEVGSVSRLSWPDQRIVAHRSLSSHGLGLGETLQLAQQLDRLPKSVVLYCLEAAEMRLDERGWSAAIPGLDELERRIVEDLLQRTVDRSELLEQNRNA